MCITQLAAVAINILLILQLNKELPNYANSALQGSHCFDLVNGGKLIKYFTAAISVS